VLTGLPKDDDVILYALPMCAPYIALNDYEFKVKIQPGSNKRGHAVKYVEQIFLNHANDRLKPFVKAVKDTEISSVFLSDVKISAPGLQKIQEQQKQKQKEIQKEKWKQQQKIIQDQKQREIANQQWKEQTNPKKRNKKKITTIKQIFIIKIHVFV